MTVSFVIPKKPVGVNEMYVNSNRGVGGGKGRFLSGSARDFKECARTYALIAVRKSEWPNLESVKRVFFHLKVWNSKHDLDAPLKASMDALEGVLYKKDSAVRTIFVDEPGKDDGPARIEVFVTLLLPGDSISVQHNRF